MPLTLANGQLAASSADILAAATLPAESERRVDVTLFNTNTTSETVVVTKTVSGGTARVVTKAAIGTLESLCVTGLALDPSDTLQGFTTTASKVDYTIQRSSPGSSFDVFALAAGGGRKTVRGEATRTFQIAGPAKVGGSAGWVLAAADNLPYLATMAASQTGGTLVLRIDGLNIGDTITGFKIVAQVESAGGTVTIDAALRAVTNVAAEPTDASIASMTQVSVTADTAVSQAKTGLSTVVTSGVSPYLLITATTGASCDIILQYAECTCVAP